MPKARLGVVTQEQKEARLKDFIGHHVATVRDNGPGFPIVYRALVLSTESPVARVVSALAADISAAGIKVEAVLACPSRSGVIEAADCRFVNDLRLLDAHEQLVLDDQTVWIGDCMRRDPLRRDAYEQFSIDCLETAAHAARSFAHIWRAAGPSGSLAGARVLAGPRFPSLFDPSLLAGAEQAPLPALLRH